ncbi:serine hydrolase [Streptomyces sp. PT12]|uniref:serine hydrolase domain-containing protein n=1 Tax=Streptomyces sp. PT12 TaxID=1510197 RepID=UPI000DE51BDF|nr:serine hydrolase domain-containing protein [Streptomyces sp. PT12]RBM07345.1 peptidase [Streptomyces sp. PT12]
MGIRGTTWTRAGLAAGALVLTALVTETASGGTGTVSGSELKRDAEAVHATGATGVIAAAEDEEGRNARARAGVADLDDDAPVPHDAYYRVGSDTKTFTAVVALQLVAEGRLGLDDTVERWLPGLVRGNGNDGARITLDNLLRQTSGLPDYTEVLFADPGELTPDAYLESRFAERSDQELVALALTEPPRWLPDADDPAGETRWGYSNTNYLLAGLIIEAATGNSWEREIHERVIEPLGLDHTLTPGTSAYVPHPTAAGYTRFPGREELTETTLAVGGGPDGGIISTTADMNTFLRALMDGTLLEPEQLAEMKRTVPAEEFGGPGTGYGLGIAWAPRCGGDEGLWFHGGTSFGTISEGAVTDDGSAAASAAVFTMSLDERQTEQDTATRALIDHALCE